MGNTKKLGGQCLCGAVKVTAEVSQLHVCACHCTMCRRWGGGPFMEIDCGTNAVFSGGDNISVFDSSDWAERGFCSGCGSHLFYRLKQSGQHMVPVGLFDDVAEAPFMRQVFIDEKPSYYEFANKTENLTGAEIFAKYS